MREFLQNIRVINLAQLLPGQYATSLLSDLGAEVINVEHPDGGNPSRHRQPKVDNRGGAHMIRDQDKRSVALNLKSDRGQEAFLALAASADIVLEGFRPGTVDRLGIDFENVQAVNKQVIYCSLTGYGQDGPYAQRPGHDVNYSSLTGLVDLTGSPNEPPAIPGYPVSDLAGALYATSAITAALAGRPEDGAYLDVSMTDAVASFSVTYADQLLGDRSTLHRGETALTGSHPGYRIYRAEDGEFLSVGALEPRFWQNLCEAMDLPAFANETIGFTDNVDETRRDEVIETLAATFVERPRDEWLARFETYDVPASPVHSFAEMFEDPHLQSRGVFLNRSPEEAAADKHTIKSLTFHHGFGKPATSPKDPAPICGADTVDVLSELGYEADEIANLEADDVIRLP